MVLVEIGALGSLVVDDIGFGIRAAGFGLSGNASSKGGSNTGLSTVEASSERVLTRRAWTYVCTSPSSPRHCPR